MIYDKVRQSMTLPVHFFQARETGLTLRECAEIGKALNGPKEEIGALVLELSSRLWNERSRAPTNFFILTGFEGYEPFYNAMKDANIAGKPILVELSHDWVESELPELYKQYFPDRLPEYSEMH
jgi:hypothetical protein